ncbi:MAG TPA: DUF882 domain-containing protein [Methylomirabilota bacterium]|jgi:uncharacterized protein YcbK (DUF882 family)
MRGAHPDRRAVLRLAALAATLPWARRGSAQAGTDAAPHALAFRNLHTGETVDVVYRADGQVDLGALREIDWVLRDFRTGEARPMDRRLLDLLWRLRTALDTTEPYEVISGYRAPATNAMLARESRGVSRVSLHMKAMAIDVRVPDRPLATVRDAALALRLGGVGYYPASDFVHVDVGRVRFW